MITIDIPTWLQIAALVLAVVYAVPKALRAVVVVTVYVTSLLRGQWPARTADRDGHSSLYPMQMRGALGSVIDDIIGWAFGFSSTKRTKNATSP
ncbi:hypothetical protein [Candidatus Poriferisodalis sp.]|uniref:hypothetical protein n=1 Tax=Candidatus Poriferisodalis sp. TaxID=3101277 RepID=UPI003D0AD7C2